ncbi:hypothetical protein ILUMI_19106 [Ignelater luminosus]|uniref:Chitin-binding type-4 domain-containing protein n=1 Tax=Ignelater luminosus TaxID=2038154 RepID=A0A8K0G3I5_IGNLU|nr:hypothetical protein ILUMI_19106 [Ignelater luminosus]
MSLKFMFAILAYITTFEKVSGHGMMLYPPSRSSLWRYDPTAPINYNDNEVFCGGRGTQWGIHQGRCGVCGDNYGDRIPRNNENTGKYGQGKVVAQYASGRVITTEVYLTTNHRGWFNYSLCNLKDSSQPETEQCFQTLLFENGSEEQTVDANVRSFQNRVQLPSGLRCKRCVLRWTYRTGRFSN